MDKEILHKFDKIQFLAKKNFYTLELLKGYCENFEGEKVDASFLVNIIAKMFSTQKHLIYQIDNESIKYYNEMIEQNKLL